MHKRTFARMLMMVTAVVFANGKWPDADSGTFFTSGKSKVGNSIQSTNCKLSDIYRRFGVKYCRVGSVQVHTVRQLGPSSEVHRFAMYCKWYHICIYMWRDANSKHSNGSCVWSARVSPLTWSSKEILLIDRQNALLAKLPIALEQSGNTQPMYVCVFVFVFTLSLFLSTVCVFHCVCCCVSLLGVFLSLATTNWSNRCLFIHRNSKNNWTL